MRPQQGFSLIELLIVIAVILTIAAIAIPQLLRAKISANEASAISAVRSIHTAQMTYASLYPTLGYADNLAKLGPPPPSTMPNSNQANLLDFLLGCGTQPCDKTGYSFAIDQTSGSPVDSFRITAVPKVVGKSGNRGFCSSQPGSISYDPNGGTICTNSL